MLGPYLPSIEGMMVGLGLLVQVSLTILEPTLEEGEHLILQLAFRRESHREQFLVGSVNVVYNR